MSASVAQPDIANLSPVGKASIEFFSEVNATPTTAASEQLTPRGSLAAGSADVAPSTPSWNSTWSYILQAPLSPKSCQGDRWDCPSGAGPPPPSYQGCARLGTEEPEPLPGRSDLVVVDFEKLELATLEARRRAEENEERYKETRRIHEELRHKVSESISQDEQQRASLISPSHDNFMREDDATAGCANDSFERSLRRTGGDLEPFGDRPEWVSTTGVGGSLFKSQRAPSANCRRSPSPGVSRCLAVPFAVPRATSASSSAPGTPRSITPRSTPRGTTNVQRVSPGASCQSALRRHESPILRRRSPGQQRTPTQGSVQRPPGSGTDQNGLSPFSETSLAELESEILVRVQAKQLLEREEADDIKELRARLRQLATGDDKEQRYEALHQLKTQQASELDGRKQKAMDAKEDRAQAYAAVQDALKERQRKGLEGRQSREENEEHIRCEGTALLEQRQELVQALRDLEKKHTELLEQRKKREIEVRQRKAAQHRAFIQEECALAETAEKKEKEDKRDARRLLAERQFEDMLASARQVIEARRAERALSERFHKRSINAQDRAAQLRQEAREFAGLELISRLEERHSRLTSVELAIQESARIRAASEDSNRTARLQSIDVTPRPSRRLPLANMKSLALETGSASGDATPCLDVDGTTSIAEETPRPAASTGEAVIEASGSEEVACSTAGGGSGGDGDATAAASGVAPARGGRDGDGDFAAASSMVSPRSVVRTSTLRVPAVTPAGVVAGRTGRLSVEKARPAWQPTQRHSPNTTPTPLSTHPMLQARPAVKPRVPRSSRR